MSSRNANASAQVTLWDDSGLPILHWAAREGNDQLVAELLASPGTDAGEVYMEWTALHFAATRGHDKVVAQLLKANGLADCGWNPLHMAALNGHEKVVEQLAVYPELVSGVDGEDWNSLHFAARGGNEQVAAILLAKQPSLIDGINSFGSNPLKVAADYGQDKVVAQLLAFCPSAIDGGGPALLGAALGGHIKVVTLLLTANPSLVDAVDDRKETALHMAAARGDEDIVDILLACKPTLIYALDQGKNTILHEAIRNLPHPMLRNKFISSPNLVVKLWKLNTDALWIVNGESLTPFQVALMVGREFAIDLLQWKLTWDEIMSAFTTCSEPMPWNFEEFVARCRPFMEQQCASLLDSPCGNRV